MRADEPGSCSGSRTLVFVEQGLLRHRLWLEQRAAGPRSPARAPLLQGSSSHCHWLWGHKPATNDVPTRSSPTQFYKTETRQILSCKDTWNNFVILSPNKQGRASIYWRVCRLTMLEKTKGECEWGWGWGEMQGCTINLHPYIVIMSK